MARKPTGKPVGAPQKVINWELFEQLCAIQCTQSEMASMLKVHTDTLRDRAKANYGEEYSDVYKRFAECGKCSLRRYQFVQSKTNTSMAIFLGKNWLGQTDGREEKIPPNDKNIDYMLGLIKENGEQQTRIKDLEARLAKKFALPDMNA
jgi:hypothetical protein